MRRSPLVLSSLLLLAACARPPKYQIHVTGYTGGAPSSIPAGATVAVVEDPAARNPLLEQEVVAKTRRALAARGFRAGEPRDADVTVMLRYGTDSRVEHGEELRIVPGQTSTVKDSTGKVIGTVTSDLSITTQPTVTDRELHWLTMTAVDGRLIRDSRPGKPVWIGESRGSGLPLRAMIDYLLVPAVSAFGLNLEQSRAELRAGDARVVALQAH